MKKVVLRFVGLMLVMFLFSLSAAAGDGAAAKKDAREIVTEGAAYLMGRHYLNLGMSYQVSALIPFTGLVFINLKDGSITLSPMVEYNIAENIYLAGGAYIGIGKKPGIIDLSSGTSRFHSEFGSYPAMFYTSFRVYF